MGASLDGKMKGAVAGTLLVVCTSCGGSGPPMPEVVKGSKFFVPGEKFAHDPATFDSCQLMESDGYFSCGASEGEFHLRGQVNAKTKKVFASKAYLPESVVNEHTTSQIRQMAEEKWGQPTASGKGFFPKYEFTPAFAGMNMVCNLEAMYYVWDSTEATIVLEDCTRPDFDVDVSVKGDVDLSVKGFYRTVGFTYLLKADAPDGYKVKKIDATDL
jgi:hypothetical protein